MSQRKNKKPPREFRIGDLVSVKGDFVKAFGTTNGIITGHEWGEDFKDVRRKVWLYWVRPDGDSSLIYHSAVPIPETDLARIT